MPHECNAYCGDDVHCSIAYANGGGEGFRTLFDLQFPRRVFIRAEPAREALPYDVWYASHRKVIECTWDGHDLRRTSFGLRPDARAFLIYWRRREDGCPCRAHG